MKIVVGIDTSNYRTSVAAVSVSGDVLLDERRLLSVAKGERGLRQSDALFAHLKALPLLTGCLRSLPPECAISAVCVSDRPRDGEDSYMPVFQAGVTVAYALADTLKVPCITTTHQRGHIAAAAAGTEMDGADDFLALHLSGGTTDLLCVRGPDIVRIGGSLDLHAGQLVDRIGVRLGLSFPAGPELEKLAMSGRSEARLPLSVTDGGLYCHLSGAEACAMRLIDGGRLSPAGTARETFDLLARTAARMIAAGYRSTGISRALVMGGIASSALFRELLLFRVSKAAPDASAVFGRPEYSGDNAVGVARIGVAGIAARELA